MKNKLVALAAVAVVAALALTGCGATNAKPTPIHTSTTGPQGSTVLQFWNKTLPVAVQPSQVKNLTGDVKVLGVDVANNAFSWAYSFAYMGMTYGNFAVTKTNPLKPEDFSLFETYGDAQGAEKMNTIAQAYLADPNAGGQASTDTADANGLWYILPDTLVYKSPAVTNVQYYAPTVAKVGNATNGNVLINVHFSLTAQIEYADASTPTTWMIAKVSRNVSYVLEETNDKSAPFKLDNWLPGTVGSTAGVLAAK